MTSESQESADGRDTLPPSTTDAWRSAGRKRGTGFGGWIAGRANRKEYWIWVVPWFIGTTAVSLVLPQGARFLGILLMLVWIRRLHDLGQTGWLAPLINITVAIAGLAGLMLAQSGGQLVAESLAAMVAIIALGALPGQTRRNQFGPPPSGKGKNLAETFG